MMLFIGALLAVAAHVAIGIMFACNPQYVTEEYDKQDTSLFLFVVVTCAGFMALKYLTKPYLNRSLRDGLAITLEIIYLFTVFYGFPDPINWIAACLPLPY